MNERKKKDDKYLDFAKQLFSKPKEEVIRKVPEVSLRKPRITAPIRKYMDKTGREAFDGSGQKTPEYENWYKNIWPTIRTTKSTKRKVTIIEEEAVSEQADLSPLIRQNTKALLTLTNYIKNIDNSLQNLTKQPLKVEIVK